MSAIDPNVLDTLRLGAHQLLGMRVPSHAAVAETVALARQVNGAGAAGLSSTPCCGE
jgi:16S rRNA (cytosine967-C5)-methyltransferase